MGVVRTKPTKIKKIAKTRDNFNCARTIAAELFRLVRWTPDGFAHNPTVERVLVEAMSYPPGASSAAKISLCWGVLADASVRDGLDVEQFSPQAIKRAVAGVPSASKDEVREALETMFGAERIAAMLVGIPRSFHEHAVDGLAAIVTFARAA